MAITISGRILVCLAYASSAAIAQAPAQTTYAESVVHNFVTAPTGANPSGNMLRDAADNIYGTAENGGAYDQGVVFKLDATGRLKVLYSFTGHADGRSPRSGVVGDARGNLYGTTYFGGTADMGVVYKLDPAGNETVLHSFTGKADGKAPYAGVLLDPAGYIYGTTYYGGAGDSGVVYRLDPAGHYTVLYAFRGGADGRSPYAGLTRDAAGNLYGTTEFGGGVADCSYFGCGVVFKVDTNGKETVLYHFTGGASDGVWPLAGVIRDAAGNLYGTTVQGGTGDALGTVYKVDTAGRETVLYSFTGGGAGGYPSPGNLIRDEAGNFYGTTSGDGAGSFAGLGVVYELDASGQETVLYTFAGGAAGSQPEAGVIRDSAGNLYGAANGGTSGAGIVYKVDPAGEETLLYAFPGGLGSSPKAGVIRDPSGNFYGTTPTGGPSNAGTVYKLDAAGHYTMLYGFTGGADGSGPMAGVIRDAAGNLYGTTEYGGASGDGVVYQVDPSGHEAVLYSFTGFADGAWPTAGVIRDAAGNLYGTTSYGAGGGGVVYKVDPSGHETVLHTFAAGAGGFGVYAGVIADPVGNLYGTTCCGGAGEGVVYKLDPSGEETVLYNFTGGSESGMPTAGVIRDAEGNLYGTSNYDGGGSGGVVFKLDSAGNFAILHSFTGGADGSDPDAGVIRDSAGNLYGTTFGGGINGEGVVYKLDPAGEETLLYAFTGGADGGKPYAGLIFDPAGNLYGTTTAGGTDAVGVVFKLTPQ